jgi:uncharacterized lipoprotein YddW (UPF0748 family)
MRILLLSFLFLQFSAFPVGTACAEPLRRGLFVSVIQDPPVLSSRRAMEELLDFAGRSRINILFVQVYRANRAWFPSRIADPAPYRECLKKVKEDPLEFLIVKAHEKGIEVHAWMNMLSLSRNEAAPFIKRYGPGILTANLRPKKSLGDYRIDGQYFLEPGDPRVRKELCGIVSEIVRAYPRLDGIQFDYIRYPDERPFYGYSAMNVERFKKETGNKSVVEGSKPWRDWKRAQVNALLGLLVEKARSLHSDIRVSATACAPYCRAYEEAFQDWPSWLESGMVDFVTLMDYSPYPKEFQRCILEIKDKVPVWENINIGIGAYKLAGLPRTFGEEFRICEENGGLSYVIFHYGSLLKDPALAGTVSGRSKI